MLGTTDPDPALLRELDDAELLAAADLLDARDEQVDTPPVKQVRETLPRLDVDRMRNWGYRSSNRPETCPIQVSAV